MRGARYECCEVIYGDTVFVYCGDTVFAQCFFNEQPNPTKTIDDVISYVRERRRDLESEELVEFIKDHPDIGRGDAIMMIYRDCIPYTSSASTHAYNHCTCGTRRHTHRDL